MICRPINVLALLSLAFCLGMATLWPWARNLPDLEFAVRGGTWNADFYRGRIAVSHRTQIFNMPCAPNPILNPLVQQTIRFAGISYEYRKWVAQPTGPNTGTRWVWRELSAALLWLALPFGLAAGWFFHLARPAPPDTGMCRACGYDLRATPDQCPECGTVPPKKETVSSVLPNQTKE